MEIGMTSWREESDYRDSRHPSEVRFVDSVERDAVRRDFTVNAIYLEPATGELLDPCGGIGDLSSRWLRTVGDPRTRLREDPLRMLRAVRFAAAAGLEIEGATMAALRSEAECLRHLSAERVFEELTRSFTGRGRGRALRLLIERKLADEVLPEVVPMDGVPQPPQFHPEGDVLTHVCMVLDQVAAGDPVQAWSAVLHDVGKPATFERADDRIRFSGHDTLSAQMAEAALRRLRAPRAMTKLVSEICRDHIRFASLPQMRPRRRERWMRSPDFRAHLDFHRADCAGSHGDLAIYSAVHAEWAALPPVPPPPPCSGADVIALGVPEGPKVGEILAQLNEWLEQQDGVDREGALAVLRDLVRDQIKDSNTLDR